MQTNMQTKAIIVLLILIVAIVAAVSLLGRNNSTDNDSTAGSKSFDLTEQNASGQNGNAVFVEVGSQVQVTVTVSNPVSNLQPIHIHAGECPDPGAIVFPLTNISDGSSVTMLDTSFDELAEMEPLALNIHKSAPESSVYFSCGDLDF